MKLLVLDNYDSFTYNLVHYLVDLEVKDIQVKRNDEISIEEVNSFSHVVLSPGPGVPKEAGIMPDLVRTYANSKKILGVCLGHQCIGEVFGANLLNLAEPVHGKKSKIKITDKTDILFQDIEDNLEVGRYHSWVVDPKGLPSDIIVTAVGDNGEIMALRHKEYSVYGVQFHPESVLTDSGHKLMSNWLEKS
jgi:anthranilate synthase component 2